jgi:hypothetical protein
MESLQSGKESVSTETLAGTDLAKNQDESGHALRSSGSANLISELDSGSSHHHFFMVKNYDAVYSDTESDDFDEFDYNPSSDKNARKLQLKTNHTLVPDLGGPLVDELMYVVAVTGTLNCDTINELASHPQILAQMAASIRGGA